MKENIAACNASRIALFMKSISSAGAQQLRIQFKNYEITMEAYFSQTPDNEIPVFARFTTERMVDREDSFVAVLKQTAIANFNRITEMVLTNTEQKQQEDIQFELKYRSECDDLDADDVADLDELFARYTWCSPFILEFWLEEKERGSVLEIILKFEKYSDDLILWPLSCEVYETQ